MLRVVCDQFLLVPIVDINIKLRYTRRFELLELFYMLLWCS